MEYTVVTAFGIMVLLTGAGGDVRIAVTDAIQSNYEGYSYAVSLSDIPDFPCGTGGVVHTAEAATTADTLVTPTCPSGGNYYNYLISRGMTPAQALRLAGENAALYQAELLTYNLPNPPNLQPVVNLFNNLPPNVSSLIPSSFPGFPGISIP